MIFTMSCEEPLIIPNNRDLFFPIGRVSALNNTVNIDAGISDQDYEIIYDDCGGYWYKFNSSLFSKKSELVVDFTRTNRQPVKFFDDRELEKWTKSSYYIDSDNDKILSKAQEITEGLSTNFEKAQEIQQFVIAHLKFDPLYNRSFEIIASKTLDEAQGTCMNFSRLYVALCRAAGVPARTIWGIVYGHEDDGIYDYHHQWAEICDIDGIWHTCDFNYTKVYFNNNMKYLDLIYAPEENTIIRNNKNWTILLKDLKYLEDNYPVTKDGRIGFELTSDNRPDSMVVEYMYKF